MKTGRTRKRSSFAKERYMDEEKNSRALPVISGIICGFAGGILMGALILFLIRWSWHALGPWKFAPLLAAACFFPACMDFLSLRGIPAKIVQPLICVISLAVILLYVHEAAGDETTAADLNRTALIVHCCALLFTLVRLFILSGRKESGS